MRRIHLLLSFALIVSASTLFIPGVCAQTSPSQESTASPTPSGDVVQLNIEFGGQTRLTSGNRWNKFEQFRDIPKNFTLTYLDFKIEKEGSPWVFKGWARDATQSDQQYRLTVERYGRMRVEFRYDGYPQFISRHVVSPFASTSPGVYVLNDTIQASLQAFNTNNDPNVPPLVNNLIGATSFADLQTRRQRFSAKADFTLGRGWEAFVQVMRDHRSGLKPIGLGTYERVGTATGGFFYVLGDELPEPLNYRTTEFRTGITYHNERALLRFEYAVNWFDNDTSALRWDNPFSLTDQQGSLPSGGANRWRFGTGQLDLYPDNMAQTISVSGRVNLPAKSFVSALAAWSWWTQDDDFLPWTLNTAIVTGVPAGVIPTDASTLLRQSLDGQINLFNSDVVLGTRNWDQLMLTGRYRVYRYDNETPQLPLPGYAAFGEAFWRSSLPCANPDPAICPTTTLPFDQVHEPNSYTRQQTSVEAVWKPADLFQWKVEPFWEGWTREHRQADETDEWGVRTQVIYKPLDWFNARPYWKYGSRRPELYNVGALEFSALTTLPANGFASGMRMFDQAHRNRHDAGVVLNFGGKGPWLVSANYRYFSDDYDQNFFGLGNYLQGTTGAEFNYVIKENYGVVAYYNHDRIRNHYRSIAKGAGAQTWILDNEWDRDTRDTVDSFGLGFNASCREERLQFSASYDLSFAEQRVTTQNPNTILANAVNDAQAHPWPNVKSRFQEVRLETSYRFRPNIEAGIRYLFEPYRLDDFAWDIMQPYMFGFEAPENDARRFLFLDSRYNSTNAHMVGFYVRYTF